MAAMAYRAKVCCGRNGFVCIKIARGCDPFEPFFTPGEFVAFGPIGLIEYRLNIPKEGVVLENGWWITPLGDTTISPSEVNLPGSEELGLASGKMNLACGISSGYRWREKSSCTLCVQWTRPDEHPVELCHKIKILGAMSPYNFITLRIPSQSQSGSMLLDSQSIRVAPLLQIEPTLQSQIGSQSLPQIGSTSRSQIGSQPPQSPHLTAIISSLKKEYPTTEAPRLPLQSTCNPYKHLPTEVVSLATYLSHTKRSKSITEEGVPPAKKCKKEPSAAKKPTLAQLMKMTTTGEKIQIINSVAPQWKQLGALLDFDAEGRTLSLIEADCQQEGHIACCQKMFMHWLNGKGKDTTWEVLLELLEDIDQSELARKVKTALYL